MLAVLFTPTLPPLIRTLARPRQGLLNDTLFIFASDNGPHNEGGHDVYFFQSAG